VIAELGDSDHIEIGEWAIAIGNPFGQLGLQRTVTVGVVSAMGRSGFNFGNNSPMLQDYIQTDAAINPGNSGGPLLDINGKVIGVNAAITTTSGGSVGIGFAIPINMAKKVAEDFLTTGRITRAYLGINPQEISPELSTSLSLDEITGVLVSRVEKNTPAEKAGLLAGDVILEVNNQKIDDVAKFRIVIADSPIGVRVPLKIIRDGRERTVQVTLTNREDPTDTVPVVEAKRTLNIGIKVDTLDSQVAIRNNIKAESGLAITQVVPNSPAARVGIRAGDVLISLERTNLHTVKDFEKVIEKAEKDNKKTLLAYIVSRDGIYRFIPINVE
jgi:serine protease Do